MAVISVIVPVYKVEKYLKRCVDSILAQTFQDFDLVLVDDGSPDQCGKICDDYEKQDTRIIVLHRGNGGLSVARNTGIEWSLKKSSSEFITFIDSDDWIHPQYLEILLQLIREHSVSVSVCGFERVEKNYIYHPERLKGNLNPEILKAEDFFIDHEWNFNFAWGKLYRKEFFKAIRYPAGKNFEDTFTTYKILFAGGVIAFISYPLYFYFYNTEGISHSLWNPSELVVMDGIREQINFYKKNGYQRALEKEEKLYVNHYAYQIRRIKSNKVDLKKNKVYLKQLRKELMKIVRQNPERYGFKQMPQCFEAIHPYFMRIYKVCAKIYRKLKIN